MPVMVRDYELVVCEGCGRERVRVAEARHTVRCDCGCEDFALYDLIPFTRDPEERYALATEE